MPKFGFLGVRYTNAALFERVVPQCTADASWGWGLCTIEWSERSLSRYEMCLAGGEGGRFRILYDLGSEGPVPPVSFQSDEVHGRVTFAPTGGGSAQLTAEGR